MRGIYQPDAPPAIYAENTIVNYSTVGGCIQKDAVCMAV